MHLTQPNPSSVPPTPSSPTPPLNIFSSSNPSSSSSSSNVDSSPSGTRKWGELPALKNDDSGIAALERETITKPRAMRVEPAPSFQPSPIGGGGGLKAEVKQEARGLFDVAPKRKLEDGSPSPHTKPSSSSSSSRARFNVEFDPLVLRAIQLRRDDVLGVPNVPEPAPKTQRLSADECTPFRLGRWPSAPPPPISSSTRRRLLQKAVLILVAHAGFDTANQSALDALTDVAHAYLCQLTSLVAEARDAARSAGDDAVPGDVDPTSGFADPLSRAFLEIGIGGGVKELLAHYRRDVVRRHAALSRRASKNPAQGEVEVDPTGDLDLDVKVEESLIDPSLFKTEGFDATQVTQVASTSGVSALPPTSVIGVSPSAALTSDATDYDVEDDDNVNTEPSSVKSVVEIEGSDAGPRGGADAAAKSLINAAVVNLVSPSSGSAQQGKKQKRFK